MFSGVTAAAAGAPTPRRPGHLSLLRLDVTGRDLIESTVVSAS
jgi:hypothetical protein